MTRKVSVQVRESVRVDIRELPRFIRPSITAATATGVNSSPVNPDRLSRKVLCIAPLKEAGSAARIPSTNYCISLKDCMPTTPSSSLTDLHPPPLTRSPNLVIPVPSRPVGTLTSCSNPTRQL
ncbi:hypothetical protein SKAU_G00175130 [Synaphobranchus kaupii]|uniref:Uncharacterized protein n=1 Tax=Synaphobranchus kaupii TaxID=118154 RepID=A0A9Q1FLI2_SYNKA|nr:hypothetical protein SKAU_G00175130 [Synaphobranchus kaupii]